MAQLPCKFRARSRHRWKETEPFFFFHEPKLRAPPAVRPCCGSDFVWVSLQMCAAERKAPPRSLWILHVDLLSRTLQHKAAATACDGGGCRRLDRRLEHLYSFLYTEHASFKK